MKQKSGLFKNPKLMTDKEIKVVEESLIRRRIKIEKQITKVFREHTRRDYEKERES